MLTISGNIFLMSDVSCYRRNNIIYTSFTRPHRATATVNQLIFAAINFCVFVFMGIFEAIYFRGCRTGLCKNNVKCVYMDIFAAFYFRELVFLANIAKINRLRK